MLSLLIFSVSSGSGDRSILTGVGYYTVRFPDVPYIYDCCIAASETVENINTLHLTPIDDL